MRYRENGDLERMQRFWFTGACEPRKRRRTSSKPLALAQFMSAFLLLGIGITFSGFLLLCERLYFGYIRRYMAGVANPPWCTLISLSIAESLSSNKGQQRKEDLGQVQGEENIKEEQENNEVEEQCDKNIGKRGMPTLSKVFAPLKNRQRPSLSSHEPNSNGHKCPDPLCETSIYTVTKQLDFCNKQIEMLQEALLMKDKSKANQVFPKNHVPKNYVGFSSSNVSQWHQSREDRKIKSEGDRKSVPTKNCKERIDSCCNIKDVQQSSLGQSVIDTEMFKEHIHGGSIAEIETVL